MSKQLHRTKKGKLRQPSYTGFFSKSTPLGHAIPSNPHGICPRILFPGSPNPQMLSPLYKPRQHQHRTYIHPPICFQASLNDLRYLVHCKRDGNSCHAAFSREYGQKKIAHTFSGQMQDILVFKHCDSQSVQSKDPNLSDRVDCSGNRKG